MRLLAAVTLLLFAAGAAPLRAHDEFRFVGEVVKMDTAKSRVSVRFREADKTIATVEIAILATTEITRDKKPVSKSELRSGVHVVVDALGDDYDNLDGVHIRIVPAPAP
jgi:hypothetical protein